ncbi:MAG: nucleoside phosphorylase [Proteobacteria bacterium]|nr:nucleoside phosphorylase [Pseudomonadota bacterium]
MTSRPSELVAPAGRVLHLGLAPGELAERIVLVGDPARALRVAARFERIEHEVRRREYVTLTGVLRGERVSVIGTGIGTDNVEIALVETHAVLCHDLDTGLLLPDAPTLTYVRVGTSGGAHPDIEPGTAVVAAYALGLDSTGLFYEGPAADAVVTELERHATELLREGEASSSRFRGAVQPYASKADPGVVEALCSAAGEHGLDARVGVTGTLPGFYGPSGRFVERLAATVPDIKERLGGVQSGEFRLLNYEMESSLLFHLAGQLGHRAGTICPIISTPGEHGRVIDYKPFVERSIDAGLDAVLGA